MAGKCYALLQTLQIRIWFVGVVAQPGDHARLRELEVLFSEGRMQSYVSEDFPRAIKVRSSRGHRQRRVIVIHAGSDRRAHTRRFLAHPIARKARAGFTGHIQHKGFNAGILGRDVFRAAPNEKPGGNSLAALAALYQNLEAVDLEFGDQRGLARDYALKVRSLSCPLRRLGLGRRPKGRKQKAESRKQKTASDKTCNLFSS